MREDIARKYIIRKKQATMVHNPLGEVTGSIFAMGMIEAWCLAELAAKALPGKQKNIYQQSLRQSRKHQNGSQNTGKDQLRLQANTQIGMLIAII